jgi:hypothetical protein
MTDMTITACTPLPGEGLVARRGDLVVVTSGQADGPDPLLGALEEVAAGDGTALVLVAARALLTHLGQFSGACAGVTASGEVTVLVHGTARATVAVDDGPEVVLTASGAMLPVDRTFSGGVVRVWLLSGGPVNPDDRLRLDGGVVYGGGLALTVASATDGSGRGASGPGLVVSDGHEANRVSPGFTGTPDDEVARPEPQPDQLPYESSYSAGQYADDVIADGQAGGGPSQADQGYSDRGYADQGYADQGYADQGYADQGLASGPPADVRPGGQVSGAAATMPPFDIPAQPPAGVSGPAEWWFTAGQDVVSGQGDDWRPPTFVMPATGGAAAGRKPQIHQPEGSDFEYVSFFGGDNAPDQHDHGHDHAPDYPGREIVVEQDSQGYGLEGPIGEDLYVADPALVDGVMCARNHFNDPNVQYCRQCGIAMVQLTQRIQKGPRPPLGVLLLDDGTGFTLDKDYVVGREPVLDGDVAAGRARPLRIPDPGGTVSRLHLRISLIGWQVEVRDLNSSNGSLLQMSNGNEHRLLPGDSAIITPGTKIIIGHRNLQYQSYRAG